MKILDVYYHKNDTYFLQPNLVGENKIISNYLENNYLPNMFFYGEPGSGKTSMAKYIAKKIKKPVVFFNASYDNKKTMEELILPHSIVFIDEFHNLDKKKQDFIMYQMDVNNIILIGASTQLPFQSINKALRSRMQIIKFDAINNVVLEKCLNYHLEVRELWCNKEQINFKDDAQKSLILLSGGDVRILLQSLENIVNSKVGSSILITNAEVKQIMEFNSIKADNYQDRTYDLMSGLQKSIRGSNVNAAIYYLSHLINNGQLEVILRRLSIIVYEDIGFGNLDLINRVNQTLSLVKEIGLDQGKIPLSHIVIEMSLSPKDNSSYNAIKQGMDLVKQNPNLGVSDNVKHYNTTYKYVFDYPNNLVKQDYLPTDINDINLVDIKTNSTKGQAYQKRNLMLYKYFNDK